MTACAIKILLSIGAMTLLMLIGDIEPANAKLVRWELHDVRFNDGATASGFFLLDAEAIRPPDVNTPLVVTHLTGWDITIELGPNGEQGNGPGYRFSSAHDPFGIIYDKTVIQVNSPTLLNIDPVGRTSLEFQFFLDRPLSELVARNAIVYGFEGYSYPGVFRYVAAGEVVAVPEPSTYLILTLAFCGLVGFSARRSCHRA